MAAALAEMPQLPVGDALGRRPTNDALMAQTAAMQPVPTSVTRTDHQVPRPSSSELLARWYAGSDDPSGAAVLYIHGGAMISGSVDLYDGPVACYVAASGVPMLSVDHRLAPEHPCPAGVEDCYAALQWRAGHAGELGVDPGRVAVMGDSAGGGRPDVPGSPRADPDRPDPDLPDAR